MSRRQLMRWRKMQATKLASRVAFEEGADLLVGQFDTERTPCPFKLLLLDSKRFIEIGRIASTNCVCPSVHVHEFQSFLACYAHLAEELNQELRVTLRSLFKQMRRDPVDKAWEDFVRVVDVMLQVQLIRLFRFVIDPELGVPGAE